jgi:hypothetical protein
MRAALIASILSSALLVAGSAAANQRSGAAGRAGLAKPPAGGAWKLDWSHQYPAAVAKKIGYSGFEVLVDSKTGQRVIVTIK